MANNTTTPEQTINSSSPEEVEKEVLKEQLPQDSNPLDLHAQMFFLYFPRFRKQLQMLPKKALIRLISSLVEFPLNDKELKARSKIEQDSFQIGDQLLTSKYTMVFLTGLEEIQKHEEQKNSVDNTTESVVQLGNESGRPENT